MSRRGWQAVLLWSAIPVPLAFGASCAGNADTGDLFSGSGKPESGGSGPNGSGNSGSSGRSGSPGASGGTKSTGGNGGKVSGGTDSSGGRASVSGGRAGGGRSGGQVGGRSAMGGASNGGKATSGGAPGGTTGGSPELSGGAGGQPSDDCDDNDACTIDEPGDVGCLHSPRACPEPGECQVSKCQTDTGDCETEPAPDQTACDDGDSCTSDDVCREGHCAGSDQLDMNDATSRPIPDGEDGCTATAPVSVDFAINGPGEITEIEVTVSISHTRLADLRLALLHVETDTFLLLLDEELEPGATLDGVYVFTDDAVDFSSAIPENAPVPAGRYAPSGSFDETFGGSPIAGTWRVVVLDRCIEETGVLHSSAVHFHRACSND